MNIRKPSMTKEQVDYRKGNESKHCGNCVMFHPVGSSAVQGKCDLVVGQILYYKVCDKWEAIGGSKG